MSQFAALRIRVTLYFVPLESYVLELMMENFLASYMLFQYDIGIGTYKRSTNPSSMYCWFYRIEADKILKMNENEQKCIKGNVLSFILISLQPRTNYIYKTCRKKK